METNENKAKGGGNMPSSQKTPNLYLNSWVGADKPKKDDFNRDNEAIDRGFGLLSSQLEEQGETLAEKIEQAGEAWSGALTKATEVLDRELERVEQQLGGQVSDVSARALAHIQSFDIHLDAEKTARWNASAVQMGTYSGDDAFTRAISLGFKPRLGAVFAIGYPPVRAEWDTNICEVYAAFFSGEGGGGGVTVTDTGITVTNTTGVFTGFLYRLNSAACRYVWFAWR